MTHPFRRRGSSVARVAITAALLGMASSTARAVEVIANGNRVFYDSFENDVINGEPSNATIGTWSGTNINTRVFNTTPPGPYIDLQYLRIIRTTSGASIAADFGSVSSGSITARFGVFIPVGTPAEALQTSLSATGADGFAGYFAGAMTWLTNSSGGITAPGHVVADIGSNFGAASSADYVDTGVPYTEGVWQTWRVDYYFDPSIRDYYTISINGITSTNINAGGPSNLSDRAIRYVDFREGINNSMYFLDAPIPEPASLGMIALAIPMLLRRRTK